MSKINPLYFVFFFFLLLVLSIYFNTTKETLLNEKKVEYKQVQVLAQKYNEVNSKWDNEVFVNGIINQISKKPEFKNEKIKRVSSNNSITFSLSSKDNSKLNSFLNEVLNKEFVINEFNLQDNLVEFKIGITK